MEIFWLYLYIIITKKMKEKKKSIKSTKPTLTSMTALYKKRGLKRPTGRAIAYMAGFNDAKKFES